MTFLVLHEIKVAAEYYRVELGRDGERRILYQRVAGVQPSVAAAKENQRRQRRRDKTEIVPAREASSLPPELTEGEAYELLGKPIPPDTREESLV